jgi:predicted membrane channel-forming protein YqfA (hemolysin III family)
MKFLLNFFAVILLISAFLYPLFYVGTGRPVAWWLAVLMAIGGIACIYLLFRFRKEL